MNNTDPEHVSPQLLRGLAIVWIGIVVLVSLCIVLGMGWGLRAAQTPLHIQPSAASLQPSGAPSGASTASSVIAGTNTGIETTLLPNQDRTFGYGIEIRTDQASVQSTLDRVQELGLGWIKYQVDWAAMESEPGSIQWGDLDAVMASASAHNLKVILGIASAPTWTRSVTTTGKNGPPDDPERYVTFLLQVIQRYQGAIHAVEIWDQQNLDSEWYTAGGLSSASYMSLLVPSSQAIRQSEPGMIIISGSLTPTGQNDGVMAVDDFRYMQEMIASNLLDHVDCVGVRHIGFNLPPILSAEDAFFGRAPSGTRFAGPYDPANPVNPHHSWSFYSTLNGYHNMIVAAGRSTPLCVTEFGWASAEGIGEPAADFEFAYDNTPQEQAAYIVEAFQSMHDGNFVWLAILFNLDYASNTRDAGQNPGALFSILMPYGSPRPAFQAIRDMPKLP
jgi:hypothetical protein